MTKTRSAPSRKARTLRALSIMTALTISGVAVSQASYAAFSASTTSANNSFGSLSLKLTNDKASTPLFTATNINPGDSGGPQYITVSMDNSVTAWLHLYAANATMDTGLASEITLSITEGTLDPKTNAFTPKTGGLSYTGSLSDFVTKNTSYATALHNAADSTYVKNDSVTYQVSWKLSDDAGSAAMGKTAKTDLVWEEKSAG